MASAFDMAALFSAKGIDNPFALQKLLYYGQGWCVALDGAPCFTESIEGWRHGPVVPAVYRHSRAGQPIHGDPDRLRPQHRVILDDVLKVYGRATPNELIELTHAEPGWLQARRDLAPEDRGNRVIDLNVVAAYFRAATGDTRADRMRHALARTRKRAELRALTAPHRQALAILATM